MASNTHPAETFDREHRRLVQKRAIVRDPEGSFLSQLMAEELLERLSLVNREFQACLLIGSAPSDFVEKLKDRGIKVIVTNPYDGQVFCDEDRLPFADHSFDLVMAIGGLDTVNDLPGALVLIRRILRPDGLFLASFPGAESLPALKLLLMKAEGDQVSAHIHPQIDVRTMGDLMMRAGFALPVVDSEVYRLRYKNFHDLIRDIRDYGGSNVLNGKSNPISRRVYDAVVDGFGELAEKDSKATETVELLYLCGWAPHPDQPKPARRGSGQISLKAALDSAENDSNS